MLYPQKERPLSTQLFQNPTSEYRGAPFWAWNCKLDEKELLHQIDCLKAMGFGGFHMHVRTGMATRYLGDEHMELVRLCVEKARKEKMLAWLYDEDRWPSGSAGGYVTKNPANRMQHMLLTQIPYGHGAPVVRHVRAQATAGRTENGELIACYDVLLDDAGNLVRYSRINEESDAKGIKLYAYLETALPSPWFNNQTYVNTLDATAIAQFIKMTHETYWEKFSADFGDIIPAIFTDEPQFCHKTTLDFAHGSKDVTLPWTRDLAKTFADVYAGENLLEAVPELLWELAGDKASVVRYHYHDHIAERFATAFADQCAMWCETHGIMLAGHMMEEPTLASQTAALGEVMRSLRAFQLPGIDMLCNRYEFTTAKQAQSVARQYGRVGTLSELYGVTNWDFDFRGHKLQGDWQAALGVTVRVPHLSWVSMKGEAKRDYPAPLNYQSPWCREYPRIETHFARVNTAMTRGMSVVRIGLVHPVESYWLHWGARENTRDIREQMDENFRDVTHWLLTGLLDFDYICESILPEQSNLDCMTDAVFPVGKMAYDVVVVPACETLRATTVERLERYRKNGGRILFLGEAPRLVDAKPSDRAQALYEQCESIPVERAALLKALEPLRDIEIRNPSGAITENFIYQLRSEADCNWLFVAHACDPENKNSSAGENLRIKIRGEFSLQLYDTQTGQVMPLPVMVKNGWTMFERMTYAHDSLLLKLTAAQGESEVASFTAVAAAKAGDAKRFLRSVPITLEEPNVLLLDMAEYALDGQPPNPVEEVLRLDNRLRAQLGWPLRGEAFAQPWVNPNESTPHVLTLRFFFQSQLALAGTKLALEDAANATITLNGVCAPSEVTGWYVDKAIETVSLPTLRRGENVLEVAFPYGRAVNVEACYLLGDFGVQVHGCEATVTPPVKALAFGDITRQGLPFYGGNIVYHLEVETSEDELLVFVPCYCGSLITATLDGAACGEIVFSPYALRLNRLSVGRHTLALRCFGTRINTFGQLHCNNRAHDYWWGPRSWRTTGDEWTYEYRFWKAGILKSPELYVTKR